MLEDIVDSKIDSGTLSFFLSAPERSFSVLEISKRLGIPYLKAAHSLSKLAALGPIKMFAKKSKKYYMLNDKYKLLEQMRAFWQKSPVKYQDELFLAIRRLGDVKAAFLSGLFCGQPSLPVDLLIVGRVNLEKMSGFLKSVEQLMGQEINYSIMTANEFLLRRDTFDKFIKDIFDYPHLTVVDELNAKKKIKK
ncbi:MAG: winged helix-turn-helix domain-containing protein [Patescibacteria group bacterium]